MLSPYRTNKVCTFSILLVYFLVLQQPAQCPNLTFLLFTCSSLSIWSYEEGLTPSIALNESSQKNCYNSLSFVAYNHMVVLYMNTGCNLLEVTCYITCYNIPVIIYNYTCINIYSGIYQI